ncbi:MAG: hypothetical protein ACYTEQ_16725 [Planctomycetota bacterium]|jgi:hypothetical protein
MMAKKTPPHYVEIIVNTKSRGEKKSLRLATKKYLDEETVMGHVANAYVRIIEAVGDLESSNYEEGVKDGEAE